MRFLSWILLLAVLAFAGRPLYICSMKQVAAVQPESHCGHAQPAPEPEHADCMLDAANPVSPAVEKAELPPAIPQLLANLDIIDVLGPNGPPPSLQPAAAFESPPASIFILRI